MLGFFLLVPGSMQRQLNLHTFLENWVKGDIVMLKQMYQYILKYNYRERWGERERERV